MALSRPRPRIRYRGAAVRNNVSSEVPIGYLSGLRAGRAASCSVAARAWHNLQLKPVTKQPPEMDGKKQHNLQLKRYP